MSTPILPVSIPPGWQASRGGVAIEREYRFADFADAFAFMARMAFHSERLNHHPEWFNVYNRLTVTLTTHDKGAVTSLDLEWARLADALYTLRGPSA